MCVCVCVCVYTCIIGHALLAIIVTVVAAATTDVCNATYIGPIIDAIDVDIVFRLPPLWVL